MNGEKIELTNSAMTMLRNCQQFYKWRQIEQLVPLEEPEALIFGRHLHRAIQIAAHDKVQTALDWLQDEYLKTQQTQKDTQSYCQARIMLIEYWRQLRTLDRMPTVYQERKFSIPLTNPDTGGESRTFQLCGKVDEVFSDLAGNLWIREIKTTAKIDAGYIERLWTDIQSRTYKFALEEQEKVKIHGICFDLLQKPSIRMASEETEAEFETRRTKLLAKSTTGKTQARRQLGETPEEYQSRLYAWYAEPGRFHRELLILDDNDMKEVREEIWAAGQIFLEARRRGFWMKNRTHCFLYNRPCAYFQLCRAGGSELVKSTFYRREAPNPELREVEEE